MKESDRVWVVRTGLNELHGWYYVGVEKEEEARRTTAEKCPDEKIKGAKRVKNVEHVQNGEFCPVPIGDYWGPSISA